MFVLYKLNTLFCAESITEERIINIENKFNEYEIYLIENIARNCLINEDYRWQQTKLGIIDNFLTEVLNKYSEKFKNKDYNNLCNTIKHIIRIYKLIDNTNINIYFQESYNNNINKEIKIIYPLNINNKQSHIISLLYIIKTNNYLFNHLIKYNNNKLFKDYLINLTFKDNYIEEFYPFIEDNQYESIESTIGQFLYTIMKKNCNEESNQFIILRDYGLDLLSKDMNIIKIPKKEKHIIVAEGNPFFLIHKNGSFKMLDSNFLNKEIKDKIRILNFKPIFIKLPSFLIIDYEEDETIKINKKTQLKTIYWKDCYINTFNENISINSINEKGNYKLTGIIIAEIINNESNDYNIKYKPFFIINNEWNEEFYKYFLYNKDSGDILLINLRDKIRVMNLFYEINLINN